MATASGTKVVMMASLISVDPANLQVNKPGQRYIYLYIYGYQSLHLLFNIKYL